MLGSDKRRVGSLDNFPWTLLLISISVLVSAVNLKGAFSADLHTSLL